MAIDKRRLHLLLNYIRRTRINRDLLRYTINRLQWLRHDHQKSLVIPHPTNAMIELGNVCNLHCVICPREYAFGKQMDQGFMPLEKALWLIDEMLPYMDSIGLTGLGETMLYPHMREVLEHIKKRKPSVMTTISTNAHFPGFLEKLTPLLPLLDSIQFSVDGTGEVYETMRPGTDFAYISDNIRRTVDSGRDTTSFMINCVVCERNYRDLVNVVRFAHEAGIRYVNFDNMSIKSMPHMSRDYYDYKLRPDFREAIEAVRTEAALHPEMQIGGVGLNLLADPRHMGEYNECDSMWEYPYITWNGYYVLCCGKPFPKEMHMGNVFELGVMGALNSPAAQEMRQRWRDNRAPEFCRGCVVMHD